MGKITFTPEDYQQSAIQYRKELLRLPLLGLSEITPFMTGRPGVRYKERVGDLTANAQFAPYVAGRRTELNPTLQFRTLETFFGSVNADFEPNSIISTLLGHKASQAMGDGQISTPVAMEVLASVAKSLGHNLYNAIWNAKRNADGTTTRDLFNGFDTITENEIASGGFDSAKRNYGKLTTAITAANAVSVIKEILFSLDPVLRREDCFMFCSYDIADAYNENYLMTHLGLNYNKQYNQVTVEGSNNKLTIVPLSNKDGSRFIHIAPKANMLYGYDQMSDEESVRVKEYAPDVLTYMARMFFGTEFESIDSRRMFVAELDSDQEDPETDPEDPETDPEDDPDVKPSNPDQE